jgi:hypothetical protein
MPGCHAVSRFARRIPNADRATIAAEKLTIYLLNPFRVCGKRALEKTVVGFVPMTLSSVSG